MRRGKELILGGILMPCVDRNTSPWWLKRSCKFDRIQSPALVLIRKENKELILGTAVIPT